MSKFVLAIDLETTGLDPSYHEITQIAAILLNSRLEEKGMFSSFVQIAYPERGRDNFIPVDDKKVDVFEFSGISERTLEKAPPIHIVIDQLLDMIVPHVGNLKDITLLGQNTKFDFTFLEAAFRKTDRKWSFDYHNLDLATLYSAYMFILKGRLPDELSLKNACETLEVINPQAHDALNDIETTIKIYKKILKEIK